MNVLYFAWLRTKTGVGRESVDPPAEVRTVGDLIDWLKDRSAGHAAAFADLSVVRAAVNQEHSPLDSPVNSDDEVAFFPPVTGG
jgi:molybdopterin synthase sulfur carrier subunit